MNILKSVIENQECINTVDIENEFADINTVSEFLAKYANGYHTFDEEGFKKHLDYLDEIIFG